MNKHATLLLAALLLLLGRVAASAQADGGRDTATETTMPAEVPQPQAADLASGGLGTLKPSGGGFGSDLWAAADGRQVQKYLSLLPETVLSPMTHELLRRALLTAASAPRGLSDADFLQARISALLAIGDAGDAGALLRTVPAGGAVAALAEKVVNGQFYAGQTENACLDVRSYEAQFGDTYWKRALVVCEVSDGQKELAQRGLASVRDDNADPSFEALASAALQGRQASVPDSEPTALDEALLRLAHAPLPPAVLRNDDVVAMAGIARTDSFPGSTRVEAAYAAAVQGGFGINDTLALLRTPGAQQAPPAGLTIARDDPTTSMAEASHREAAFVQQAEQTKDDAQKKQLLRRMLTTDSETVDVPFLARVEFLRMQTMGGDRTALAPAAARGFLLEGDLPAAKRWYDIALQGNGAEAQRIWPLAYIAYDDMGSGHKLEQWARQAIAADKENGARRVERVLAAVAALGGDVPDALWAEAIGKPDDESSIMGSLAVNAALANAVRDRSRGEVILLVALSLKDGPGHAHPMNLNHAVAALWHAGMLNQAKAIALEGLAPVTDLSVKE